MHILQIIEHGSLPDTIFTYNFSEPGVCLVLLTGCPVRWCNNLDTWLDYISWHFYQNFILGSELKGGILCLINQNSEKNLTRHSKSLSKPDFPFWNCHFLLVLYTVCYDFDRGFWVPGEIFSEFWLIRHKIPPFNSLPNIKFW